MLPTGWGRVGAGPTCKTLHKGRQRAGRRVRVVIVCSRTVCPRGCAVGLWPARTATQCTPLARLRAGRSADLRPMAERGAHRSGGSAMRTSRRDNAFTLIELLVVIAII